MADVDDHSDDSEVEEAEEEAGMEGVPPNPVMMQNPVEVARWVIHLTTQSQDEDELVDTWNFISHVVDDGEETPPMVVQQYTRLRREVYAQNVLDALSTEMRRPQLRLRVLKRAMVVLTMTCLSTEYFRLVADHPLIIPTLIDLAKTNSPSTLGAFAITCLTNLAIHAASHATLIQAGALPVALSLLRYLHAKTNAELDCGLTAGFFVCRVSGRNEVDLVTTNPILIEKLAWILDEVIRAGPEGTVIGYNWNPANIMNDILILATPKRTRNLLGRFVGLITSALKNRSRNVRMVRLAVNSLMLLIEEPECHLEFINSARWLKPCLEAIQGTTVDIETAKLAHVLIVILESLLDNDFIMHDNPDRAVISCAPGLESIALELSTTLRERHMIYAVLDMGSPIPARGIFDKRIVLLNRRPPAPPSLSEPRERLLQKYTSKKLCSFVREKTICPTAFEKPDEADEPPGLTFVDDIPCFYFEVYDRDSLQAEINNIIIRIRYNGVDPDSED